MSQPKNKKQLAEVFLEASALVHSMNGDSHDIFPENLLAEAIILILLDLIDFVNDASLETMTSLKSRIKTLIKTAENLVQFNKLKQLNFLLLERELLRLHKLVLESSLEQQLSPSVQKIKTKTVDKSLNEFQSERSREALNPIKKELLGFITSKKEVLNLEIFTKLSHLTKRSLKRHLSDLIASGYVSRESQGKKVYYRIRD